ncbi:MAG: PEP/pyruvate-binding domain-containing protein [Ardenticatenaceae bacterium]|nr:PEP/pyruvate-binding domain-containing protein [Ardenticatenaceae bacterium]
MSAHYTLSFADPKAVLAEVGGKGASLTRLAQANLPVPDGFHVTTAAYRTFVEENNLQPRIFDVLKTIDPGRPATLEAASAEIGAFFAEGQTPTDVAAAVTAAYTKLAKSYSANQDSQLAVAVRSSATAEDLPDLSFAGQQETFLNVCGVDAVLDAVKQCWASLWTARAIGYRERHAIDQGIVSLAVVVQVLVPAEVAGILFTANPQNGRRDQCVISTSWGLGEAVVGGLVTPDTFTIEDRAIVAREIADKKMMTVGVADGTEERQVPEPQRRAPTLNDEQALELARLGQQIEQLYGMPMDIEWALAGGEFAIVQARPITALPEPAADPPNEWPLPATGMYMRASITEQMPDPLSPLFGTLAHEPMNKTIHELMKLIDLKGIEGLLDGFGFDTINGYVYIGLNISGAEMARLYLVMIPQTGKIFRHASTVWCDVFRPRYLKSIADWQARPPSELAASELLAGAKELLYRGIEMYTGVQVVIPVASMSEFAFNGFYNRLVKRQEDVPAHVFLLGFDSQPILADKSLYDLAQWSREQPPLAEYLAHTPAAQVADQLECEQPPSSVDGEMWSDWRTRFSDHLAQFGNAIYNLDFVNAVPADAPAPVIETLKFYMQGEGQSPYQRQEEAVNRREKETQAALARLDPLRRVIFRKLLTWAQKGAPPREDALAAVGLGWPLLRRLLRELGGRLVEAGMIDQRDDVFWLEAAEVSQAAAALDLGQTQLDNLSDLVTERKMIWRGRMRVVPPQALPEDMWFTKRFERFMPAVSTEQTGAIIKGIAVSEGQVTARARVLYGPEDFATMQPGEVLVAGITTPAWTPLFPLASAVVTDIGGPLSHSSIVAREYGIPAVLGTGVATQRIQSGQQIRVDGDNGTVTLIDEVDPQEEKMLQAQQDMQVNKQRKIFWALAVVLAAILILWWKKRRR